MDNIPKMETIREYEKQFETMRWVDEIPTINFKPDWDVKIIPPFGGAVVRFIVTKGKARVSVYLDCYDLIGIYGEPYWEIYPGYFYTEKDGDIVYEDTMRYDMKDTSGLIKGIEYSLEYQLKE